MRSAQIPRLLVLALVLPSACTPEVGLEDEVVVPPPVMVVGPPRLDFGVVAGDETLTLPLTVANQGVAPLHVFSISIEGSARFSLVHPEQSSLELSQSQQAAVQVVYRPEGPLDAASVVLLGDDPMAPQATIALTGSLRPDDDTDTDDVHSEITSGTTGHTGTISTADTGPPPLEFDCNTIPVDIVSAVEIPGARGYHDVAFDSFGRILGISTGLDLIAADVAGEVTPLIPNLGRIQQMVWLPDGDLAVAHDVDGIIRIRENGAEIPIAPSIRPYGLILGPDEQLYAANQSAVYRVDPTTGVATELIPPNALAHGHPRVINFSLDYDKLFIGTYQGSQGRIYSVPLDATLTPTGAPTVFATGVGSGSYHDGLGVDICGYLYVPDYSSRSLFRITPSGQVQTLWAPASHLYIHGLEWGTGADGWSDMALYGPKPYDTYKVERIEIGVPSRDWTGGIAINKP